VIITKPPWIIKLDKPIDGKWRGRAIWPFIWTIDPDNIKLMKHEHKHIEQQLRGWLVGFAIKYFYYQWKYGYWDNPYEVEARAAEEI
jgi:hypothetical protein